MYDKTDRSTISRDILFLGKLLRRVFELFTPPPPIFFSIIKTNMNVGVWGSFEYPASKFHKVNPLKYKGGATCCIEKEQNCIKKYSCTENR